MALLTTNAFSECSPNVGNRLHHPRDTGTAYLRGKTGDHVAHRFHMRTVSLQIKGLSDGPLTNGGIHCLRLSE